MTTIAASASISSTRISTAGAASARAAEAPEPTHPKRSSSTARLSLQATRRATRANRRLVWGSPAVYFVALLLIGAMLAPVVYIILGGFRTNAQITTDPAG